jgi:hypothetical protein
VDGTDVVVVVVVVVVDVVDFDDVEVRKRAGVACTTVLKMMDTRQRNWRCMMNLK